MRLVNTMKNLLRLPSDMRVIEWLFLVATAALFAGYILGGTGFARIGLPLSWFGISGNIPNQGASLFVTEIYLFTFGVMALPFVLSKRPVFHRDYLFYLLLVFVVAGLLRGFVFDDGPIVLRIRNAAFVWYCLAAFILFYLPVRVNVVEGLFRVTYIGIFLLFFCSLIYYNVTQNFVAHQPKWTASFGIFPALAFALIYPSRLSYWVLATIGLALGIGYWSGFQRTSLLGMIVAFIFVVVFFSHAYKRIFLRLSLVVVFFAIGIAAWPLKRDMTNKYFEYMKIEKTKHVKQELVTPSKVEVSVGGLDVKINNPFNKALADGGGFEVFRWQMWLDSLRAFKNNWLFGIGFFEQVVHRQLLAEFIFVPNDGRDGKPPISGPHNSYLNAFARMGVFGVVLLVVHFLVAIRLLASSYYAAFSAVMAHMLYAVFNVGLEGPVRSMALILGIGMALKLEKTNSIWRFLENHGVLVFSGSKAVLYSWFTFSKEKLFVALKVLMASIAALALVVVVVYFVKTANEIDETFEYLRSSEFAQLDAKKQVSEVQLRMQNVWSRRAFYMLAMQAGRSLKEDGQLLRATEHYGRAAMRASDITEEREAVWQQALIRRTINTPGLSYANFSMLYQITDSSYPQRDEVILELIRPLYYVCRGTYFVPWLKVEMLIEQLKREVPHSTAEQEARQLYRKYEEIESVRKCL